MGKCLNNKIYCYRAYGCRNKLNIRKFEQGIWKNNCNKICSCRNKMNITEWNEIAIKYVSCDYITCSQMNI